ncbi:sugar porter family MFS transporter [Flavobacterium johnsoniae]|uniref:sugar porter family MFS transporter n=1 Tax=Flavobacterium johnsoniae TaxID=986 RepID=UPI0025B0C178|nr:sugar porter family MFS transporter [Flavobacterium johnsoniae]WJS93240.1 sugar porter family MFS transporter [Flavobacterium johnsoniae]
MKKSIFAAFVVSLGGFLFGFDAGIISGVMSYVGPEFNLNDFQTGWVVSSPSFTAMFAMLISGRLSDIIGRKKLLILASFLYALSIVLSAYSFSYEMLYIARMIGGIAFGIALVIAPTYIAEVSLAENRGKLVSIQQLNIVLGFFAAFLSNYYINYLHTSGQTSFLTEANVWRWMLGIVIVPSIIYYIFLFFVPESPRWLFTQKRDDEARKVLVSMHGIEKAKLETETILESLKVDNQNTEKLKIKDLFKPALKFVFTVGLVIGILQQITGINAIYFYATSIFKQTGIGNDASFSSGVLLSFITVAFTIVAMFLIDKMGRRPLLLVGIAGIAISMALCAYGFKEAKYQLTLDKITLLEDSISVKLKPIAGKVYENDIAFKNEMKTLLGDQIYAKNEGTILEMATQMNAVLVLVGVMGFIACFAFSLGPVMWVLLSELYPNRYRGLAIGVIGFVNGFVSWIVQQVFPWELSNLGNAFTFSIFGAIALIGFFILYKILPETKGKSLEQIEIDFVK